MASDEVVYILPLAGLHKQGWMSKHGSATGLGLKFQQFAGLAIQKIVEQGRGWGQNVQVSVELGKSFNKLQGRG